MQEGVDYRVYIDWHGILPLGAYTDEQLNDFYKRSEPGSLLRKSLIEEGMKRGKTFSMVDGKLRPSVWLYIKSKNIRKNGMTLQAVGRNVLIKPDPKPKEEVSDGGIVIVGGGPQTAGEYTAEILYGEVVSVGNGGHAFREVGDEPEFGKPDPALLGKRIGYRRGDVMEFDDRDHVTYHALDFEDIVFIVTESPNHDESMKRLQEAVK